MKDFSNANFDLEKCVDYLAGKQNRAAFHMRPPRRREAALELVHTDVCYVDAPSHRGRQYFVTFIDDHSQKTWAFVLKSKDQVCWKNQSSKNTIRGIYTVVHRDFHGKP